MIPAIHEVVEPSCKQYECAYTGNGISIADILKSECQGTAPEHNLYGQKFCLGLWIKRRTLKMGHTVE